MRTESRHVASDRGSNVQPPTGTHFSLNYSKYGLESTGSAVSGIPPGQRAHREPAPHGRAR
jgi:hypothetical protein